MKQKKEITVRAYASPNIIRSLMELHKEAEKDGLDLGNVCYDIKITIDPNEKHQVAWLYDADEVQYTLSQDREEYSEYEYWKSSSAIFLGKDSHGTKLAHTTKFYK